jgi:hypothetical protein
LTNPEIGTGQKAETLQLMMMMMMMGETMPLWNYGLWELWTKEYPFSVS